MSILELNKISKSYGGQNVLTGIDLSLASHQTYVLLGPSGCGKSTLIKIMIGLILPDTGNVQLHGETLTEQNVLELRRRTGYVIQDGGLFPHMTAHDNVAIVARFLQWEEERISARIDNLASLTQFPVTGLCRFPAQLSGGQRQRVGLMRALMLDPDLLLMDEPLGALDPMVRSDLQDELKELFRTLDKTVVMVTHDLFEASHFGDEIILLNAGQMIQRGKLQDFITSPADPFVKKFVNAQRTTIL